MFENLFYHTSLDYSGKDDLVKTIIEQYNKQPTRKPSSWEENVHTSIVYDNYENNLEYFQKAGIPIDLVLEIDKIVQSRVVELNIDDIGKFYISEMWYNVYGITQYQHMHKHSNKNNNFFSGVYYMKFNDKVHSATRFYNPGFEVDFDKIQDNSFFISSPEIKEDDIFIFPSDVGHDVPAQTTDELRITVAFNVACIFNEKFQYG